jgi:GAF domain-containing protein
MNFFENRSLKSFAIAIIGFLILIFLIEFLIIRIKIEDIDESQARKDYARTVQLQSQQIAYLIQLQMNGENQSANIYARLNDHDHSLSILGKGGRIDGTSIILNPLSRLPGITYDHLLQKWANYKTLVNTYLEGGQAQPTQVVADSTNLTSDSTRSASVTAKAQAFNIDRLSGEWLTLSNWYDKLVADLNDEYEDADNALSSWFLTFVVIDLLLLTSLILLFYQFVIVPVRKMAKNTASHIQDTNFKNKEFQRLAKEINEILEQLKDATEFVAAIGQGKLDYDYKILDADYQTGKNRLADSLIQMQEKLKSLNEEEQRRQWANEGLTKFVDILRSSEDSINTLGDKIISALVKYTNSNQGGLYILNDEDEENKYLELISLFAFDLKKYQNRKIILGEGILGQTFLEKETTVLTEIPEEYIRITSGLGDAYPKSLLIVPLKVDKEVYGIVELASFKNYQPHEITFVEKLAETIASTLAAVKVGQKNRNLIEQFQQQTEEMRAQEEEMRQNMEELQATQEELSRKEQDYLSKIAGLESHMSEGLTKETFDKLKNELTSKEQEYHNKVRELERKIADKQLQGHGDDWALATEVEKTLRIQLEALKITEEELKKKAANE